MSPTSLEFPDSIEEIRKVIQTTARLISIPTVKQGLLHTALGKPTGSIPEPLKPTVDLLGDILRTAMDQRYETEKHVATRLNLSVRTLQNARCKGVGPVYCHPLGLGSRAVRYNTLELELWLLRHTATSTSQVSLLREKRNG